MDKLPTISDSYMGQMSRFCYRDLFATFHLCPEDLGQFSGPEELALLPLTADPPTPDNFYSNPCRFPFQVPCGNFGRCDYSCSPAFIQKRNERERQRVKCVNEGYAKLRHHLPPEYLDKRLSKVETLRAAIKYIKFLQSLLCDDSEEDCRGVHHSPLKKYSK
ncbi:ASCL3: Achaete-scute family bHLH transcription factor 3 [Crotalus adamanteus]|uniref:ASCL3: Achaete-scute family bHLH transcription factor 3 n=1 Tax=Crotalus adamanteus TaxID=8729 RepID=A0AAW1C894_CROAD|nr:achaete-scute homolog 3 [Crotalus tigris]